jgi:hypothetical protein
VQPQKGSANKVAATMRVLGTVWHNHSESMRVIIASGSTLVLEPQASAAALPLHVVSVRAGHAHASVTLNTYAHLIGEEDERAAEQADKLFESIRERK